jgi:hypothetical protein
MNKLVLIVAFCVFVSQIECGPIIRPGQSLTGGRTRQDLNNPDVLKRATELAEYALNIQSFKDQVPYVLESINSFSTQLVNGRNHWLSLRITDNDFPREYTANVVINEPRDNGLLRLVNFWAIKPRILFFTRRARVNDDE